MPEKQSHRRHRPKIRVSRKASLPPAGSPARRRRKASHEHEQARARHGTPHERRSMPQQRRRGGEHRAPTRQTTALPEPGENLRIIPLGGVEEIGKNMTVIEYKDDIIVVDAGFQFSEAETPGIDYIIPNVTYLEERKHKVRAVFITHGHYDHIGAVPYIMPRIGNPPIYSRGFGAAIIKKRQTEFEHLPKLDVRIVEGDETIKVGTHFTVEFFPISHAIPDSMGLFIKTPIGTVAFVEDVRVDHVDGVPTLEEKKQWERFGKEEVLLFTLDSTSVYKPGFSTPESKVVETITSIIKDVPGRLIIGTFASQVERVIELINAAERFNKYVVVDGRSMKTNVEIARQLKLLDFKNIIPIEEMKDHPPNKIVIMATGAQGEEYSVLDRIANGTHKHIKLGSADTVLLSSSIIPGNERSITKLKDNLYRQDAHIITYLDADVHASGHGSRGELAWIHRQINYKFFVPLHGHHFMLRMHAELAEELGAPKERIVVPDNGSIIEITPDKSKIIKRREEAPSDPVMVDGFSVSDKQEVVIRDRKMLAEEGMFVVVVSIDPRTGKVRKSPDIIARGFVYLRESQQLLNETRAIVKRTVESTARGMHPINFDHVKNAVTDEIRKHLFQRTAKSPIVIPVIIGV